MKNKEYFLERKFILKEILQFISKFGCIDSESVSYNLNNLDCNFDDFCETWDYIHSFDKRENKSSGITEKILFIKRDVIWKLIILSL